MRVEEIQLLVADVVLPPPDTTVSQWADENRRLSSESAAERGEWRTDRAPYQRAIMDALSPSHPCEQVVLMSGAQLGKTSILENFIGYIIDLDPGPLLLVQPREADCEAFSKDRLAPMLRDCATLRGKIAEARSRDSNNTILHKKFTGGSITMSAASSPAGLAMRSIRYCLLDEVDRYPASAGSEGDPVNLTDRGRLAGVEPANVLGAVPALWSASGPALGQCGMAGRPTGPSTVSVRALRPDDRRASEGLDVEKRRVARRASGP